MPGDAGRGSRGENALPVAPSLSPTLERMDEESAPAEFRAPREAEPVDRHTILIAALAIAIALAAGLIAQLLVALIGFVTNLAFYGRLSTAFVSPGGNHLGLWAVGIPVIGGLIVGVMARYGSAAIRGHGIPEVMEKVLYGESRIPARVMFLKPLSAAVAIGTGGPFGAEGPIIATGGALGSVLGQVLRISTDERKVLLAAGAAAGMAATFGSPVSAVLLAVELLLFEYRPRSLVPVALAAATAAGVRIAFNGSAPVFGMPQLAQPTGMALAAYAVLGGAIGALAAWVTRFSYWIEDVFEWIGERFDVHWMWWPAIGALAVGVIGIAEPRTLGVGYDNITAALSGTIAGRALFVLVVLKLLSWAIYLGSGTSGGTLAPLFTIGGGAGALIGSVTSRLVPSLGVDARIAALVGMAAIFAGASHALLASVVFAFETTRQPVGLLPLLAGCAAAYLVSLLFSRHSIMTEKLARRGTPVHLEYTADHLAQVLVRDAMTEDVVTLSAERSVRDVADWLAAGDERDEDGRAPTSHQGFPVVDAEGSLVGVVSRRDLLRAATDDGDREVRDIITRPPVVVYDDSTLRQAGDHMVLEKVGRLPVVTRERPDAIIGIITVRDLLSAHSTRLAASRRLTPHGFARRD